MIYKGYYIEETPTGYNIYASYEDWRDSEEPMHTAASFSEAEQWVDEGATPFYTYPRVLAKVLCLDCPKRQRETYYSMNILETYVNIDL